MSENAERFEIAFHGPAVEDHSISARDLGASMVAIGELMEGISTQIQGRPDERANLYIRATRPGSFEVAFELVPALAMLSSDGGALDQLCRIFTLFRVFKGLLPSRVDKVGQDLHIHLHLHGDETEAPRTQMTLVINESVYEIYADPRKRRVVRDLVSPLNKEGLERMDVNRGGETLESVEDREVEYYDRNPSGGPENYQESFQKLLVTIVNLSFDPKGKWRVAIGVDDRPFFVGMLDEEFKKRVAEEKEYFRAHDTLLVDMRTTQWMEDGTLRSERDITRVIEHHHADEQTGLWDQWKPPASD